MSRDMLFKNKKLKEPVKAYARTPVMKSLILDIEDVKASIRANNLRACWFVSYVLIEGGMV